MTEFFDIIFSLPTAIFTWPLMLVVLYWGIALAGLFDLHWFDGADGALDGAIDGAIDGAADGVADAVSGGMAKLEGGLAKVEGGLGKLEAASGAESMHGPGHLLGLGDVPRTFSGSLLILFGWTFSVLGTYHVPGFQETATRGLWLALLLAGGSLVLAFAATAVAIQPLRRLTRAGYGPLRRDLLGQMCTITTQRVDARFGQAELEDGSSLIQVRSREKTDLSRGSRAVIFDYDDDLEAFLVAPVDLEP